MSKKKIDKKKKKDYNMLDFVLLGILIALLFLVIGLGIFAIIKNSQKKQVTKVDMSVPIIEEKNNTLYLDLGKGKKGDIKTYLFKIKNHYKDNINTEEYTYKISFTSDTDIGLSLYEQGSKKNLLNKKTIETEEYSLKKNIKDEHIYEVKIKLKEDTKANTMVYLKIEGKKKNGNS